MQTQKQTSAKDRVWTGLPETKQRRVRTGIDEDLAWFLECGGVALGERGTMAGIVNALELGGHAGGVPKTDLYDDAQIGWGRHMYGEVERHRWLLTAWNALTPKTQRILLARYSPPPANFRSDQGYGAREKWIEGAGPGGAKPQQPIGKRGKPIREKQFKARLARWQRASARVAKESRRTGVEAVLGDLAMLAFAVCANPEKLFLACRDPKKANREIRDAALKAARVASEEAHTEWAESKTGADPMRKRSERTAVAR